MANEKSAIERFEETNKRFETLKDRRRKVQVQIETTKAQLLEACADAKAEFGTDNLNELRDLYRNREAENLQKVIDFTAAVDEAEQELVTIEQKAA